MDEMTMWIISAGAAAAYVIVSLMFILVGMTNKIVKLEKKIESCQCDGKVESYDQSGK